MTSSYPAKFPHTQYGLTFAERSDWVQFLKAKAESVAASKGIPRGVMGGLIEQESSWGAGAINKSNKNGSVDAGLTQINNINWPTYGIERAEDLTQDPLRAIEIGADILSSNIKARVGDIPLALADYNQGAGATNAQLKGGKPPSAPVQKYVTNVMFRAAKYGAPYPTSGDIQQIESRLKFKPDVVAAAKAAGLDPGVVSVAAPAQAAITPDTPLTLPTAQPQSDVDYEQQIAQIEALAAQQQTEVAQPAEQDASMQQSLQIQQPASSAPLPPMSEDMTLDSIDLSLPEPGQDMSIDDRLTAAFGPEQASSDTSNLPRFVDSLIDSVVKTDD